LQLKSAVNSQKVINEAGPHFQAFCVFTDIRKSTKSPDHKTGEKEQKQVIQALLIHMKNNVIK